LKSVFTTLLSRRRRTTVDCISKHIHPFIEKRKTLQPTKDKSLLQQKKWRKIESNILLRLGSNQKPSGCYAICMSDRRLTAERATNCATEDLL
jgi:hypothetical protein